jgi:hypothetical protein
MQNIKNGKKPSISKEAAVIYFMVLSQHTARTMKKTTKSRRASNPAKIRTGDFKVSPAHWPALCK